MEGILDQPLNAERPNVQYGGFWIRFLAIIIDGIALAPLTFGLAYYNMVSWKSTGMMILISVIGIVYKPLMEAQYGASLGKMALGLRVTNLELGKITFGESIVRNIFNIVPSALSLYFSIEMFNDPDFESITGFMEFASFSGQYAGSTYVNYANFLVAIVDAIMCGVDPMKRSLHDRIAGTLVIEK